jgi:hypothetical protein
MSINPIACSYWRVIKAGGRTYASVPATVKDDVLTLARSDVEAMAITPQQYEDLIGEVYAGTGER